jgi:hypothetical protein
MGLGLFLFRDGYELSRLQCMSRDVGVPPSDSFVRYRRNSF